MDEEMEDVAVATITGGYLDETNEKEDGEEQEGFEDYSVIDFDYEYDAPKFFDFSRKELDEEIVEAERWFDSAQTYPPSPFIVKLLKKIEKGVDDCAKTTCTTSDMDDAMSPSQASSTVGCGTPKQNSSRSSTKPFKPKSSTLLKPTASHLAKLNRFAGSRSPLYHLRLQKSGSVSGDVHATKRQKLEIGYLRKVAQLRHQALFTHKSPKKPIKTTEVKSPVPKVKVTQAKGPDLSTAQRAERHRSKNVEQLGDNVVSNRRTFKARPLNKKILEGPLLSPSKKSASNKTEFQVFHLRTSERAIQQSCYKVTPESGSVNFSRTNSTISSKHEEPEAVYKFKARPLNKKIFTSKGEMGVSRITKREVTKPKEFKFLSDKRVAQNPPIELFKKLSLKSEHQTSTVPEPNQCPPIRGSEENSPSPNSGKAMMNGVKEKSRRCGLKQSQFGGRKSTTGIENRHSFSRNCNVTLEIH